MDWELPRFLCFLMTHVPFTCRRFTRLSKYVGWSFKSSQDLIKTGLFRKFKDSWLHSLHML